MQGDFPKYTKKCLERIWMRLRDSQKANPQAPNTNPPRAKAPSPATKVNPIAEKSTTQRTARPAPEKPKAITTDMLENLKDKFKK